MPHRITQCYLPPGRGDIPAHSAASRCLYLYGRELQQNLFVCLCDKHTGEPCKSGWTDWNAAWEQTRVGPRNHDGGPNPLTGKALQGKCDGHPFDNGRVQSSRPLDATNRNVRRILVRGSMPPCRLRRRKFWKFDYEMVHSEVYLNKYVVSTAPFSTPARPDCSQNINIENCFFLHVFAF